MTKKKVTKVDTPTSKQDVESFVPTPENKKKANQNRIFAIISWLAAIGTEVFAILQLNKDPINTTLLIVLVAVIAILAIFGSLLWKKANRLDPASKKDKVRFFIQNQLGLIISIIAFLPLIILLLQNDKLDKKSKSIVTAVAVVALAITAYFGIDFNPPSVEKYTEETAQVQELMGKNEVFWTKSGRVYHLYNDCYTINTDRTDEIFEGTVAQAYELKNIKEICKICVGNAEKSVVFIGHDHVH